MLPKTKCGEILSRIDDLSCCCVLSFLATTAAPTAEFDIAGSEIDATGGKATAGAAFL